MDCNQDDLENNEKTIKEDPVFQLALINKYIKVHLIKNTVFIGFVHSIDPLTQSIILSVPKEQSFRTVLLPGYAVLNITNETQPTGINPPEREHMEKHQDVINRKTRLLAWLKFNRLPVSESGDDIVFGNVCILPPYNTTDLCTDNPIVALQVKKLIESMPKDFHS